MAGKFKLSITMNDDAMKEPAQLAEALKEVAGVVAGLPTGALKKSGVVVDDDQNSVGKWEYVGEEDEDDSDDADA